MSQYFKNLDNVSQMYSVRNPVNFRQFPNTCDPVIRKFVCKQEIVKKNIHLTRLI